MGRYIDRSQMIDSVFVVLAADVCPRRGLLWELDYYFCDFRKGAAARNPNQLFVRCHSKVEIIAQQVPDCICETFSCEETIYVD